jgi:Flp pilus assembly protein TadG
VSTSIRKIEGPGTWRLWCTTSGLAGRVGRSSRLTATKFARRLRETEAAELLEFALALPLILVMVVGLLDFSHAYNIKQKLANAVREGARIGGSESVIDTTQSSPASVQSIKDDVTTYLQDAGIDTSFIGTTLSWTPCPGTCSGTYYTTSGGINYGLEIERNVLVTYTNPNTSQTVTVGSTRVTLFYPYDWTFGFDQVIKLLVPSATFTDPIRIETDAMMANPD